MEHTVTHVLLVEDHALVRAGIRSLIERMPDVEVVGEAGTAGEAFDRVAEHAPDLILLDVGLPEISGLEVAERIHARYPHIRLLMLSMYTNDSYVIHALRAGASGYLLKDAAPIELGLAIHAVMRDETYLSPAISKHVVADYLRRITSDPDGEEQLTPRQREVLRLIARGYTAREIARALTISVKTVETHRMSLMERLDIHDIAGLVRYAIRVGLVVPAA